MLRPGNASTTEAENALHDLGHPQYRPRGPSWRGQDASGRSLARAIRCNPAQGIPRARDDGVRLRSPGKGAASLPGCRNLRIRGPGQAGQRHRHPGVSRLPGPQPLRARGGGDGGDRGERRERHRGDDPAHDGFREGAGPVQAHRRQQDRQQGCAHRGGARRDPRDIRQSLPAAQPACRRRQGGRGLLLPGPGHAHRFLVRSDGAHADHRPGGRGRREADGAIPRAGRGNLAGAAARPVRAGTARGSPGSDLLLQRRDRRRHPGAHGRPGAAGAEPGRGQSPAVPQGRRRRSGPGRRSIPIPRSTSSLTYSRSPSTRSSASSAYSACIRAP